MQKTIDDLEDNLHTTKSNLHAIQHASRIQETKYKDLTAHVEDQTRQNSDLKNKSLLLAEEKSALVNQNKKLQKDQDKLIQLQDEQSKSEKNSMTKLKEQLEEANEELRQQKLDSIKESSEFKRRNCSIKIIDIRRKEERAQERRKCL